MTVKAEKREARTARWQNEALIKLGTGKYARKRAEKAEAKAAAGSRKAWKGVKKGKVGVVVKKEKEGFIKNK